MNENETKTCCFDALCTRANCRFHHPSTKSGKSPEADRCRYRFECTRKKCPFEHYTVDGLSPAAASDVLSSSQPMSGLGICTWNVLSETLAAKMVDHYCEEVLDTEKRWALLSIQLQEWMAQGFILCLQEVTRDEGLPRLEEMATEYLYLVVFRSHGTESNGSLGNAILVPPRYRLEKTHFVRAVP